MAIKDFLATYDISDGKSFSEHELYSQMKKLPDLPAKNIAMEDFADIIAFGFVEEYQDKLTGWGTYFGPFMVTPVFNGPSTEEPSIQSVNKEILDYWRERSKAVIHPQLIARYSALVWDFTKHVTKINPPFDVAIRFINAAIRIATERCFLFELDGFRKLKYAFAIACKINDNDLIAKCKTAIIELEAAIGKDQFPGLWGYAFDILVFNKKAALSSEEENAIIQELEAKFERLTSGNPAVRGDIIWPARHAAIRLADYYRKKGNKENVRKILVLFGTVSEAANAHKTEIDKSATAEDLYKLFNSYHLREEAAEMLLKVRELNSKVPEEMKLVKAGIEIPSEKIKEYLAKMTTGGLNDAIHNLIFLHIPIREHAIKDLESLSAKNPISYLFVTQITDHKGRVLATIGPLEKDLDGQLVKQISTSINIGSLTLRWLIEAMITKFGFNSKDILNKLNESPVFTNDRLKIIEIGLDAYFNQDYVTAIHIIIPQIEEAVRNIVEKGGGNVLKEAKGGSGFHLRTFDDILRDDLVTEALQPDGANYFKILFTDQRGWNLRNNVCHGMSEFNNFNYQTADRVVHALLYLSTLQFVE